MPRAAEALAELAARPCLSTATSRRRQDEAAHVVKGRLDALAL